MRIGIIGIGNMGSAIINGYVVGAAANGRNRRPDAVLVYDTDTSKTDEITKKFPIKAAQSLAQLIGMSEIIVICVKPNIVDSVLDEIAGIGVEGKIIVSIAAGVSIDFMASVLGENAKIVRAMPNTPAMIGVGMTAISPSSNVAEYEYSAIEDIFASAGKAVWIPEYLMDIATGISGSSPAYVYMFIEGLINAGVANGLSKEAATIMAAQSTLGAAMMVLESGKDPVTLRENVCSPGGTTIEAVNSLESDKFMGIVEKAAQAATDKSKKMAK